MNLRIAEESRHPFQYPISSYHMKLDMRLVSSVCEMRVKFQSYLAILKTNRVASRLLEKASYRINSHILNAILNSMRYKDWIKKLSSRLIWIEFNKSTDVVVNQNVLHMIKYHPDCYEMQFLYITPRTSSHCGWLRTWLCLWPSKVPLDLLHRIYKQQFS